MPSIGRCQPRGLAGGQRDELAVLSLTQFSRAPTLNACVAGLVDRDVAFDRLGVDCAVPHQDCEHWWGRAADLNAGCCEAESLLHQRINALDIDARVEVGDDLDIALVVVEPRTNAEPDRP